MPVPQTVDAFLNALSHNRKDEILTLRKALITSADGITETVKWNAPNFCWKGKDRATMRLHPDDRLEIILHCGAKKTEVRDISLNDPAALVTWAAPDRGVIKISDRQILDQNLQKIVAVVLGHF